MPRPFSVRLSITLLLLSAFLFPFSTCFAAAAARHKSTQVSAPAQPGTSTPLLPATFAGWQIAGTPQESTNPQAADAPDAEALREYGFTRYEAANYQRDSDTLAIKAMEFGDVTGAFGSFTFYRRPNMAEEPIGRGGAFDGTRVLFWSGSVLVDARFSRLTPMSAAELRDLATQLPQPIGNLNVLPTLPAYLPPQHLEPMTIQYAIGPQAYRLSGGVLPVALVGFDRSAEVVTAQYDTLNGPGTLTIINYPTLEIAMDREQAIRAYIASRGTGKNGQNSWTSALATSNPAAIQSRRSGPLVAVTSGSFAADAAHQVLQSVHYEVSLTMGNHNHYVPDTAKVAQIILNVTILVGIFALIAIVAGVSLGGGRVLWKKMRRKAGESEEDSEEFIRLNLKD